MKRAQGWSTCCKDHKLGLVLWLLAGCATPPSQLDRQLQAEKDLAPPRPALAASYVVGCPDVLEVTLAGRADLSGPHPVDADGCIDLGTVGRLRVERRTLTEIQHDLGEVFGLPPAGVQIRVAEYRSQQIYIFGQVSGLQRAVPYQGQETVLDLLQRVGGVTPGAAAEDVSVVRTHVTEGRPPEVFHIDLTAILAHKDLKTNLVLQPFDQVYVGQSRRSSAEKVIPPLLRPMYELACGLRRSAGPRPHALEEAEGER
ncbi:MAG: polysaccharide biosynthesis/export family protein [Planctomycetes bacterium]|nr:polysaccharide biosynthesis/export family protein [Planctomycetota bacterium]